MTLRVLVVESEPDEILFLHDVLAELDGSRDWSQWTHVETLFADCWAEAASLLETQRVDVIVLDLDLDDVQGKETFRRYQALVPEIPAVLVVQEASDQTLAGQLLREGAQDFLIRKDVDCAPLARAIRNAVDRHRLLAATRATSMVDSLTGLLTRDAFLLLAERDRQLATAMHRRQLLILAEPRAVPDARNSNADQDRDLDLVVAAEHLRKIAGAADLVARVGLAHLALSILDSDAESAEEIWARLHQAAATARLALGAAVYDPQRPVALEQLLAQAAQDLRPVTAAA